MLEYPELGMEAVYKIEVEDLPAFIGTENGNDFFNEVSTPVSLIWHFHFLCQTKPRFEQEILTRDMTTSPDSTIGANSSRV